MFIKEIFKKPIDKQIKRIVALALVGTVSITSFLTVKAFSKSVQIDYNGETTPVFSTLTSETSEILKQARVDTDTEDYVSRKEDAGIITIIVKTAHDIEVEADGKKMKVRSAVEPVAEVVSKAGVQISDKDETTVPLNKDVSDISEIKVIRRVQINLDVDSNSKDALVPVGTIKSAIEYLGIMLGENDTVSVNLEEEVSEGMQIKIDRVGFTEETKEEEVPYKTIVEKRKDMNYGEERIATHGVTGRRTVKVKTRIVNGQQENSEELESIITKEPVNEVKFVGTVKPASVNVAPASAGSTVYMQATAYCDVGRTASGMSAGHGRVAVDTRVIPLGTRLWIEGYGEAVAADTGGAIKGNIIDLWFPTKAQCASFGRRTVAVKVIG